MRAFAEPQAVRKAQIGADAGDLIQIGDPFLPFRIIFRIPCEHMVHGGFPVARIGEADLPAGLDPFLLPVHGDKGKAFRILFHVHAAQHVHLEPVSPAPPLHGEIEQMAAVNRTVEMEAVPDQPEIVILMNPSGQAVEIFCIEVRVMPGSEVHLPADEARRMAFAGTPDEDILPLRNMRPDRAGREPAAAELFQILIDAVKHRGLRVSLNPHRAPALDQDEGLRGLLSLPEFFRPHFQMNAGRPFLHGETDGRRRSAHRLKMFPEFLHGKQDRSAVPERGEINRPLRLAVFIQISGISEVCAQRQRHQACEQDAEPFHFAKSFFMNASFFKLPSRLTMWEVPCISSISFGAVIRL